jgi:excisionase family DNA binding protein
MSRGADTSSRDRAAYAWLTVSEAAGRLRVSNGQVRRLIAAGEISAVDVSSTGGRATWRVGPESLDQFVLRRQTTPRRAA